MTKVESIILQVSCPLCGKIQDVDMKIDNNENIPQFMKDLVSSVFSGRYDYSGEKKCWCGKLISVTLSVTAMEEE
ncbi:hypothetical protein FACS1894151_10920 [Spirochaetia bacterium]|nr:hypothetical protein FACS1894151_10920 [Spirochaetia bacterium]